MGLFGSNPEKEKRKAAEAKASQSWNEEFEKTRRSSERTQATIASSQAEIAKTQAIKEIELEKIKHEAFMALPEEERKRITLEKEAEIKRNEEDERQHINEIANAEYFTFTIGNKFTNQFFRKDLVSGMSETKLSGQIGFAKRNVLISLNIVEKKMFSNEKESSEYIISVLDISKMDVKSGILNTTLAMGTVSRILDDRLYDSNGLISFSFKKSEYEKILSLVSILKESKKNI